jgi:hypothetical protein
MASQSFLFFCFQILYIEKLKSLDKYFFDIPITSKWINDTSLGYNGNKVASRKKRAYFCLSLKAAKCFAKSVLPYLFENVLPDLSYFEFEMQ